MVVVAFAAAVETGGGQRCPGCPLQSAVRAASRLAPDDESKNKMCPIVGRSARESWSREGRRRTKMFLCSCGPHECMRASAGECVRLPSGPCDADRPSPARPLGRLVHPSAVAGADYDANKAARGASHMAPLRRAFSGRRCRRRLRATRIPARSTSRRPAASSREASPLSPRFSCCCCRCCWLNRAVPPRRLCELVCRLSADPLRICLPACRLVGE